MRGAEATATLVTESILHLEDATDKLNTGEIDVTRAAVCECSGSAVAGASKRASRTTGREEGRGWRAWDAKMALTEMCMDGRSNESREGLW